MAKWFVGFDCATKTFAFSIAYIDLSRADEFQTRFAAVKTLWQKYGDSSTIDELHNDMKNCIRIMDGETVELFPGIPDKSISTVDRIKAVSNYVKKRIIPSIEKYIDRPYQVVIEFQMGANSNSKAVTCALIALFAEEDTILVGPTLKNKISLCAEGEYAVFAEKYKTAYGANKAHAVYNFMYIERLFGTNIPETNPKSLRGHIADSFMQILGHLIYGKNTKQLQL